MNHRDVDDLYALPSSCNPADAMAIFFIMGELMS
jgi:hypothetical protein